MTAADKQWQQTRALFEAALELPIEQRELFLTSQPLPTDIITEARAMLLALSGPTLAIEDTAQRLTQEAPAPERLGSYQIIREIGRGGMGKVYLGERDDDTFSRQVAIKTLTHLVDSPVVRQRFKQEQRLHARLEHPNIARLMDAGSTADGKPFLVMQYVDGIPITEYTEKHTCTIEQRVKLIIPICDAIAFAHGQLILHRDIKPPNMLVTEQGESILLDFGIAKLLDDSNERDDQLHTRLGDQLMTLAYASPEQIREEELTTASDVYSLGVALYEVLTGKRPFLSTTNHNLTGKIVNQEATAPLFTPTGQKVPRDLQAICLRALEKNTIDRYPTASALAADLHRYLKHQVVEARPPNVFDRLKKLWRRNPVAVPLSALAAILIMMSVGAAWWQAQQAQLERDIANNERDRSEQVVKLLLDLFDSDPLADTESRRDDITLRAFLMGRSRDMQEQLSDQPDLQATLLNLLANLYANLGQLVEAEPFAEKALSIRRELYGGQHIDVASSLNTLATLRQFQGRYDDAEPLFREALAIRTTLLPANHHDLADSINNLGTLLYERGNPEDQAEIFIIDARAMDIREQRFGSDSVQVAESLNSIGTAFLQRNQDNDLSVAESMFRRALSIRRDKLGNAHPATAIVANNLANLLDDIGQHEEAESLFLESIEMTGAALGESHPRLSAPLYGLSQLYQEQARWPEAEAVSKRSLQINLASLPADHPYLLDDLIDLTNIYLNNNDLPQAKQSLRRALAMPCEDAKQIAEMQLLSDRVAVTSSSE